MPADSLRTGDSHYTAFVGPPTQYDFMGATQFRLLCALGLRSHHKVLDFGCGSLRAGRLLLPYLDPGRYFGTEPNRWLIDEAVRKEIGEDLIRIKAPQFRHNDDFSVDSFFETFNFIIAQSIFSHTGPELLKRALSNFKNALTEDGVILATFVEGITDSREGGWTYPGCVSYRPRQVRRFASETGLFITRLPWYHPRQTWYVLARSKKRLPTRAMKRHLTGAVLFDPQFRASWAFLPGARHLLIKRLRRGLPAPIMTPLKKLVDAYRSYK